MIYPQEKSRTSKNISLSKNMPIQNLENLAYKPKTFYSCPNNTDTLFISSSEQASAFAPVGRAPGAILAHLPDSDCSNSWG